MNDIKTDAWQGRNNQLEIDWRRICEQQEYTHNTVLQPAPNRSKRRIPWSNIIQIAFFITAVAGTIWAMFN